MVELVVAAFLAGKVEFSPGLCQVNWMLLDTQNKWHLQTKVERCDVGLIDYD